jgi:hypothetical protein
VLQLTRRLQLTNCLLGPEALDPVSRVKKQEEQQQKEQQEKQQREEEQRKLEQQEKQQQEEEQQRKQEQQQPVQGSEQQQSEQQQQDGQDTAQGSNPRKQKKQEQKKGGGPPPQQQPLLYFSRHQVAEGSYLNLTPDVGMVNKMQLQAFLDLAAPYVYIVAPRPIVGEYKGYMSLGQHRRRHPCLVYKGRGRGRRIALQKGDSLLGGCM